MGDRRDVCWYCGGRLCWDSDHDLHDVVGEGEGILTFLHCTDCQASVEYCLSDEDEG